jgi:putative Mn2+ efflux pump MntP
MQKRATPHVHQFGVAHAEGARQTHREFRDALRVAFSFFVAHVQRV